MGALLIMQVRFASFPVGFDTIRRRWPGWLVDSFRWLVDLHFGLDHLGGQSLQRFPVVDEPSGERSGLNVRQIVGPLWPMVGRASVGVIDQ